MSLVLGLVLVSLAPAAMTVGIAAGGAPASGAAPATAAAPAATIAPVASGPRMMVPDSEPGMNSPTSMELGGAPAEGVHVLVTLTYRNPAALTSLLAALSNPSSPDYHQYLTAAEFDSEFAPSPAVYGSLVNYVTSLGATGVQTHPDRTQVGFTATPAQVQAIFGTSLDLYAVEGQTYYAATSAPSLPASLAPYVASVVGLSDYSKFLLSPGLSAAPAATAGPAAVAPPPGEGGGNLGPCSALGGPFTCTNVSGYSYPEPIKNFRGAGEYIPASDLQVAYNMTPVYAQSGFQSRGEINNTVATLLWSDLVSNAGDVGTYCEGLSSSQYAWDFYQPDVAYYFNATLPLGEPHSDVFSMAQASYAYSYPLGSKGESASCDGLGANIENTLDVEMAGSLAPGATVYQLFGGGGTNAVLDADFADVLSPSTSDFATVSGDDTARNVAGLDNVSVISNSWIDAGLADVSPLCIPCVCTTCHSTPGCLVNDTSWYEDLEQAQARGISVVAGSGDTGDSNTCAPAAQAYANFGDVAVGGTTLVLNPQTLQRSPLTEGTGSNPYTVCGGATTYCGSEIGWFQAPLGGEGTGGGSVGGVVPVNFTEPAWQKASADANKVITSNTTLSPTGRGEPDLAAIANNTEISVTLYGTNDSVADFNTSDGPVYTPLEGVSIATPVVAGMLNAIDYALLVRHDARVGFIDPAIYRWGQKEYTGGIAPPPFFDVVHGQTFTNSAAVGYDLVTGWGVPNGENLYTLWVGYRVTFAESGLPSGSCWKVTITGGGRPLSSCGTSVYAAEPNGTFTYALSTTAKGYAAPGGPVTVAGANAKVSAKFSSGYLVTFTETGLKAGTTWWVNLTTGTDVTSHTNSVQVALPNSGYVYAPASDKRKYAAPGGYFTVSSASVNISVGFGWAYSVTFTETGLPSGTAWYATLSDVQLGGTVSSIAFSEPNGTFAYSISGATSGDAIYKASPGSGNAVVSGAAVKIKVTYSVDGIICSDPRAECIPLAPLAASPSVSLPVATTIGAQPAALAAVSGTRRGAT